MFSGEGDEDSGATPAQEQLFDAAQGRTNPRAGRLARLLRKKNSLPLKSYFQYQDIENRLRMQLDR